MSKLGDYAKMAGQAAEQTIKKATIKGIKWLWTLIPPPVNIIVLVILIAIISLFVFMPMITILTDSDGTVVEAAENNANNIIQGGEGGISLTTTMFDKDTFKKALQEYYDKTKNSNFKSNFLDKVDTLYDTSVANNVNPELVVVTAKCEGSFTPQGGSYNYWGIGVYNGSSSGGSYSNFADGIKAYADTLKEYEAGGKYESLIIERYEARKDSGCDVTGYGGPGTLSGMQSVYSDLGKHEYGSAGTGGYYYMDPSRAGVTKIYSTHAEFETKCLNIDGEHAEGVICTAYERGQYTAWQVEEKISTWNEIFGNYGSLSSNNDGEGGTVEGKAGDGYDQVYKSSTGRTYKEFEQWKGSYSGMYYGGNGETINSSGCSITAVATVLSGYGSNKTPASFSTNGLVSIPGILHAEIANSSSDYEKADRTKLLSGKPAVLSISGTVKTEKGSKYYSGHYISVLDAKGSKVYIADPGANNSSCGGWANVEDIISIVNRGVIYVYEK